MIDQIAVNTLKKALYYEQLYMNNYPIPMDIENTYIGASSEVLLKCIHGSESISPGNLFTFRIVSRIADLLMGISDPYPEDIDVEHAFEMMKMETSSTFSEKFANEIRPWDQRDYTLSKDIF